MREKGKVLMVLLLLGGPPTPAAQQQKLPPGVARVLFGTAERTKNSAGTETCRIVKPLADLPAFERGVTEITYTVELEPRSVKSAATQVAAPPDQGELRRVPCNAFTIFAGGYSQTQLGNTISRADKAPLKAGAYKLRITVDGQTAEVPFTIK